MNLFARMRRAIGNAIAGRQPDVRGSYDAASSAGQNKQHWTLADALDSNLSNSPSVRSRLVKRARYETENNGHGKGLVLTQANYVVGRGPKLRMQTGSPGFNAMLEAAWNRWTKAVKLPRKLRTAIKAKVRDGETFLIAKTNLNLPDFVKLDLVGIECEQCQTPDLPYNVPNYVDGIRFDDYGNPLWYDILAQHPGGQWGSLIQTPERVPARYVFHLQREDRFGQCRAVPEITATLNQFAQGRRFREATIAAAENIANFSIIARTQQSPEDGADAVRPYSTLPMEKGMMVHLPMGWDAFQPRAEQPASTYDAFNRSQINEQARPLSMPYNIAAADSSGYSFSGGRLDHLTYFVAVDVEQEEIETIILDPLFQLWFEEAVLANNWTVPQFPPPAHSWDWPAKPQIDDQKTATARQTDLGTGVRSLRRIYAEDGLDFEDELPAMAADYGVTEEEMRAILLKKHFGGNEPAAPPESQQVEEETGAARSNGQPSRNGNGRIPGARR